MLLRWDMPRWCRGRCKEEGVFHRHLTQTEAAPVRSDGAYVSSCCESLEKDTLIGFRHSDSKDSSCAKLGDGCRVRANR